MRRERSEMGEGRGEKREERGEEAIEYCVRCWKLL